VFQQLTVLVSYLPSCAVCLRGVLLSMLV